MCVSVSVCGVHAVTFSVTSLVSYSKRLLCDVMIVAEDVEVEAHRVVLAACSPYFCAMFTGMARVHSNLRYRENTEGGHMRWRRRMGA